MIMRLWPRLAARIAVIALPAGLAFLPSAFVHAETAKASDGHLRTLCVHGVETGGLNVRSGPGLDQAVIGSFGREDCNLSLAGRCEGSWCEMTGPGARGWVDTRYVGVYELPSRKADSPAARSRISEQRYARRIAEAPRPRSRAISYVLEEPRMSAGPWSGVGLFRALSDKVPFDAPFRLGGIGGCVAGVASWDTLRMRSGPGVSHRQVGEIPSDACRVRPAGQCRGLWCRVDWHGREGWVNTYYLR
ncbi:MAG: SH3 domain-containing protein [Hyphomicrobiaceae bacterium]